MLVWNKNKSIQDLTHAVKSADWTIEPANGQRYVCIVEHVQGELNVAAYVRWTAMLELYLLCCYCDISDLWLAYSAGGFLGGRATPFSVLLRLLQCFPNQDGSL